MKNSNRILVLGIGTFSGEAAKHLSSLGHEVTVIDFNQEKVEEISEFVSEAICLDIKDKLALSTLGANNFDLAIIGVARDFEAASLATLYLKEELKIPRIYVKCLNDDQAKILRQIGATRTFCPEKEFALTLGSSILSSKVRKQFILSRDFIFAEIAVPDSWDGKTPYEVSMLDTNKVNLLYQRDEDDHFSRFLGEYDQVILKKNHYIGLSSFESDFSYFIKDMENIED